MYAFSYDLSNYAIILAALKNCFADSSIKVYLKIHPDYAEEQVMRRLGMDLAPNFVLGQKLDWIDLYKVVDCIFYDDNSIGLEGLIQGVKTFNFIAGDPIYNCDRMFGFNLWKTELDEPGMKELRLAIESGSFDKNWDRKATVAYVKEYYTPYAQAQCYSRFF